MDFAPSDKARELRARVERFITDHVMPRNHDWRAAVVERRETWPAFLDDLRSRARSEGLWNLALPLLEDTAPGTRLTNLEFAHVGEVMGWVPWAPFVFNSAAPDVPNMEILQMFGTDALKDRWLKPLLEGEIRSSFAMTEPEVASSDATNIATRISDDGDHYVINGHKWFASNAGGSRTAFTLVVGVTDPDAAANGRHSIVLVPNDTPGYQIVRNHSLFNHDDIVTPHSELMLENVLVPKTNLIGTQGAGFLIGQSRLGPARIHHCIRAIGQCEVLLRLMIERARGRTAFGKTLVSYANIQGWISECRLELEQARLLVLRTAWAIDTQGGKAARKDISLIKIAVARTYFNIADRAIQMFGAMGVTDTAPFAAAMAQARAFRIYDGPDEVHHRTVFRLEEAETRDAVALSPTFLRGPGYQQPT